MLTNQDIRNQFGHSLPHTREDVEARRNVREKAAALAVFLNETLVDSSLKDDAIQSVRHAAASAIMALQQNGPTIKSSRG